MKRLTRWSFLGCLLLVALLPMCACLTWTQEPKRPTEASPGTTSFLQWNFESVGDRFWFLLVFRNTSTSNNSSEQDIALKLANGSSHLYDQFKNRTELIDQATLIVHDIKESDAGRYCCKAFFVQGMYTSCVDLLVLAPPAISIHPMNTSIIEFTELLSFCNASGQPRPIITWRRKDKEMMFPPGEYLSLPNVSRDDTGLYECIAKNSAGHASMEFRINVLYQPTAQVIPGNVTVNQSDAIALTCMTSGNPAPNITWTIDGNESVILSADNKLELVITSKANEGGYRCTAANGIGLSRSSTANVFVKHHRPMNTSFISCSSDNTAWVNDGVVFTCSSVSSPSPATYVIYHNGKIIKKNKSGYHKICNVKLRHAGTYACEPRNTFGVGERRSVSFTVYEKPAVHVIPRVLNSTEGSSALFICSATGSPPPNITWTAMSSGEIYNGAKLEIKAVQRNDTGNYQCAASNGISGPVKDTAFLNVYYSPSITDAAGPRVAINEGATLKLYCHGDGNPQPVITWKLLGTSQTLQEQDERLMILNTQKSHAGVYLCTASNFLGNDSKTIAVDVWCPPFVIDGPHNQTINESDALSLTCNIGGNPPANISWYHDSNKELTAGSVLFISHANRSHAGSYRCIASNGLGNPVTSQANVLINYKPTVLSSKKNISSWIGHETRIQCRAEGFPRPTIHWSGKGVVTNVIFTETTSQSTLTVTPTSQSDFTTYSCYAQNNLGYDTRNFILVQLVTSDPPVITHLQTGSSFIRVSWKAPLNKKRKRVIGYLVQAIDDSNPNNVINCSDVANNSCTIYGLKPDTTYVVRVQATNAVGYGFSAYEKVVTEDKGHSKKRKTETDNGGDKGFSTTMLVCVLAGIGGAISFIVMVSLLVKRCKSTGKGSITKE